MPILIGFLIIFMAVTGFVALCDSKEDWKFRKTVFRNCSIMGSVLFLWLWLHCNSPYRNDPVITEHKVEIENNRPYVTYNGEVTNVAKKLGQSIVEGDTVVVEKRFPEWHYGIRSLEITKWSLKNED